MAVITAKEILSNPAYMKAYVEWLDNPVTKLMFDAAATYARPQPLTGDITGEQALYHHGEQVGFVKLMDLVFNLERLREAAEKANAAAEIPADYDAERLMKENT